MHIRIPVGFLDNDKRLHKLQIKLAEVGPLPYVIRLWDLTAKESPRYGALVEHSPKSLENALRWDHRKGKLVTALVEAGFLEKRENGYQVLNWVQDQGHIWYWMEKGRVAVKTRYKGGLVATLSTTQSTTQSRPQGKVLSSA